MPHNHVCPWYCAYFFDNPIRKLFHNPAAMFGECLIEGMTALDVGCGMGYFSIGMARLVGAGGKIIAVDLQQEMLNVMSKRAIRAGVRDRIDPRLCNPDNLGVMEKVNFILTFWMVHEVPDQKMFFKQLKNILAPRGYWYIVEPKMHVTSDEFAQTLSRARTQGWVVCKEPVVKLSRAAILQVA